MRANHNGRAVGPGLLLVSVGLGLTAREFGLLPEHVRIWDFWPLFIVLIGLSALLRGGGFIGALFALAFIATGSVLLAGNLGFMTSSVTRLWPVLLVLLGLVALFRRGPTPEPHVSRVAERYRSSIGEAELTHGAEQDYLSRQYVCSGAQLHVESQAWKGGELAVTAGGVELDLRHARLDPDGAVLAVRVLMGGIEIRVPDTWQVHLDVVPFFGGADDSTRSTQGVSSTPRLRVIGNVTLGGVNVSN